MYALGFTSLFMDIASEMTAAILPAYFVIVLGASAEHFGAIDGLWRGLGPILGAGTALFADRRSAHKLVALAGYSLSAVARVILAFVPHALASFAALLVVDRMGKGIRTGPRDALIAAASTSERRASAFAVHRALDTLGRVVGPLIAFCLLPAYDAVFVTSACAALIAVLVLGFFVRGPRGPSDSAPSKPQPDRSLLRELRASRAFLSIALTAGLLGAFSVSEGFVYLGLQRHGLVPERGIPVLVVSTAIVQLVLVLPFGRLADRFGRRRVFLAGHLFLLGACAAVAAAQAWSTVACVACLGTFLAATEGALAAHTSLMVDARLRATALAVVAATVGFSKLVSSWTFGVAWEQWGPDRAFLGFGSAMVLVLSCAAWRMSRDAPRT